MTVLVVGVGHRFRGDDGAGPLVADRIRALALPGVTILDHHGEGTDLMERWAGFDRVVVADATASGATPGTVRLWNAAEPLPAGLFPKGSHVFGLAEGIEMARLLGRLPQRMLVVGIEGRRFSAGDAVSVEVASGIDNAVDFALTFIRDCEMSFR